MCVGRPAYNASEKAQDRGAHFRLCVFLLAVGLLLMQAGSVASDWRCLAARKVSALKPRMESDPNKAEVRLRMRL